MSRKIRIGIVGCGAIGTSLAKAIRRDFKEWGELTALYDLKKQKAQELADKFKDKSRVVDSLEDLTKKSDLVIEAASAGSSFVIAREAISKGCDVLILSVGGIIGKFKQLSGWAKNYNCKIYIPSGAISGIDALKAVSLVKIKKVILTTRKNPQSFSRVAYIKKRNIDLKRIKRDTVLFSGTARKAVKFFPQNINVAALLSLAGIGQDKTFVKIIASPKTKKNIHEILIESDAGKITTRTENVLHPDNPKTSFLAVLSVRAMLRQILHPVKIGT